MILLDEDDKKVSILNISINQVPEKFVQWLRDNECYEYMDTSDLQEHLYNTAQIHEECPETAYDAYLDEIDQLLEENNCTYFRIVNG
jgi:hypothetical protein